MINNKQIVIPVDFFDHVYWKKQWADTLYDQDDIRRMMSAMVERGKADVCLWRLSACGAMTYRSRVEEQKRWDPRAPARAMNEVLNAYDPLAEAVNAAGRADIPLYAWITLFDEGYPPNMSRFLQENPHCQWVDRTGTIYAPGIPCYDYDETIEFRLKHIRELLDYGVNGLYLSLRSHSDQATPFRQKDFFGFNDPVVEEYKRRHGKDIRKFDDAQHILDEKHFRCRMEFIGGEFDIDAWHRLKGESLTRLLREVHKLAGADFPIWLCFIGPFEGMELPAGIQNDCENLTEGIHAFARFHIDWQTWLEEKLVDTLVVQCHRNMAPEYGVMPFEKGIHERGGRLVWFAPVGKRPIEWEQTEEFVQRVKHLTIDGVMPYEAVYFDFDFANHMF